MLTAIASIATTATRTETSAVLDSNASAEDASISAVTTVTTIVSRWVGLGADNYAFMGLERRRVRAYETMSGRMVVASPYRVT